MKRQKDMTLEDEPPRSEGAQYATGEEKGAVTNSSRKNEVAGPKQRWYSTVNVSGGECEVWLFTEQYYTGTWNVGSRNQCKLDVVKQKMAKVNIDIPGINELQWMGRREVNSDDHYIYYYGQESLRRNGALIVNRSVWNAVLGCNLKNERMISVHF